VFALHADQSAAANDGCQPERSAPERCESTHLSRRDTRQRTLKALARNALRADGLAHDDLASAQDCNRPRITDILATGGRNVIGDDVLALGEISPSFRAGVIEYWRIHGVSR
jgi:hypothetical protein